MPFLLLPLVLTACAAPKPALTGARDFTHIAGQAIVVSINDDLGTCVLQIGNDRVSAYWNTITQVAQPGAVVYERQGFVPRPVGEYREPAERPRRFAADPGDLIAFRGLRTGNEIYLSAIQVLSHK